MSGAWGQAHGVRAPLVTWAWRSDALRTDTYDDDGNLLSLTDPLGNATWYAYDDLDRLARETVDLANLNEAAARYHRTYECDDVGNLTT